MRVRRLVVLVVAVLVTGAWSCAPPAPLRDHDDVPGPGPMYCEDFPRLGRVCWTQGHDGTG